MTDISGISRDLPSGGRVYQEVTYSSVPGYRPLVLDLYVPAAPPVARLLYLHGGAWRTGTRREFPPAFQDWTPGPLERLAAAGFAVASADYRLSGEAAFPAQLDDVRAALRWLKSADLGTDRVAVWGESAGGLLAALAALAGPADEVDDVDDRVDGRVDAVVDWYGPSNLISMAGASPDDPGTYEAMLLGGPIADLPEKARAASPVHQVRAGAPAFHLAHGTADRAVPFGQSVELAEALREVGAEVELSAVEGAGHAWEGHDDLETVFRAAVDFLLRKTA
jgi:acetyl esterase/lipase